MADSVILAFQSTHSAIQTHRRLEDVPGVIMMPTLRDITASCGISIAIPTDRWEDCRGLLSPELSFDAYLMLGGRLQKLSLPETGDAPDKTPL